MKISRLNIVLGIVLLVVVVFVATVGADRSGPNVEFLPNMKRSPAYSAYEKNVVFSNGRTLQTPVPGTVARGEMPLHYAPTPKDAVRHGDELENPIPPEGEERQASIARGSELFEVFCMPCHGGGGKGDGLVVGKGYPAPTESLVTGKSRQMKDGQLFHIVTYGKYPDATTKPPHYPRMPPFAPQLTSKQRWDVISFIRSLQAANPVENASTEPADAAAPPANQEGETTTEREGEAPAEP